MKVAPCEDARCPCETGNPCAFEPGPEILDACCGGRMWWWDKSHPLAVYMDKRIDPPGSCSHRPNWSCEPDLIGDFRAMPFEDEKFQLVLFDPPHNIRETAVGKIGLHYGALPRETEQEDLRRGLAECWRVLVPGGTLVFKWAGALERVKPHFPATPIVGTRSLRKGSGLGTRWFVFYKPISGRVAGNDHIGEGYVPRGGRMTLTHGRASSHGRSERPLAKPGMQELAGGVPPAVALHLPAVPHLTADPKERT